MEFEIAVVVDYYAAEQSLDAFSPVGLADPDETSRAHSTVGVLVHIQRGTQGTMFKKYESFQIGPDSLCLHADKQSETVSP